MEITIVAIGSYILLGFIIYTLITQIRNQNICSTKPKRLETFALKITSLLPIATITSISLCEAPYSPLLSSYLILSPLNQLSYPSVRVLSITLQHFYVLTLAPSYSPTLLLSYSMSYSLFLLSLALSNSLTRWDQYYELLYKARTP